MSSTLAEELKSQGNSAFATKRYEEAITLYTQAIEADPNNFVYYSNRAGAYHELKQYDKAIEDARKSISIHDNAKAHSRVASALWAQNKLLEAKSEYETAASLDPGNTGALENIRKLQQLMNASVRASTQFHAAGSARLPDMLGGEFCSVPSGPLGVFLDLIVLTLSFLTFVLSLVRAIYVAQCWQSLLLATMAQQLLTMRAKGLAQPNMGFFRHVSEHFCTLVFCLCGAAALSGIRPDPMLAILLGIYSICDIASRCGELPGLLGPAYHLVAAYVQKAAAHKATMLLLAATLEAMLAFSSVFTGGSMFTLIYMQYIKNRYRRDAYVQLAFHSLRVNVTRLTSSQYLPAFVDRYAQAFFDFLHKFAVRCA